MGNAKMQKQFQPIIYNKTKEQTLQWKWETNIKITKGYPQNTKIIKTHYLKWSKRTNFSIKKDKNERKRTCWFVQ